MSSVIHYINNKSISIYNFYKYLACLYKSGVIPEFKVEICNKLTKIVFMFNYNNNIQSTIIYNTNTGLWTSYTNVLKLEEIYNNLDYSYLFDNKMIGYDNDMIILQSYDINDILEPSLTPFNKDQRDLHDNSNKKLHNIDHRHYYMFITNLYNIDKCNKNITYNDFIHEYL